MRNLSIILFFCVISACSSNPNYDVMDVIFKYSNDLKKDGIILRSYGLDHAGQDKIYDGKIHEVSLGYSIDKNLQYSEARKLFYHLVDGLLAEINRNQRFRDIFFHFPITYADLELTLSFDYESKGHLNRDDVDQIGIYLNKIYYFISKVDGLKNEIVAKEMVPGMGTLSFTGLDSTRSIVHSLPEKEEDTL